MEDFYKEGFLIQRNFFDLDHVERCYQEIVDENESIVLKLLELSESNEFDNKSFAVENMNLKYLANANQYFNSINRLISSSVSKFAERIIGDEVYLDAVELHQKLPGASLTPPHQDNFYFCLKEGKSTTAYIPLNSQSKHNGGLAVMPRSHLVDFPHYKSDVVGFSSGIESKYLKDHDIYDYILNPGDISFHHCNIVHLAPENSSTEPRLSIALRFKSINDEVCPIKQERYIEFANQSVRIEG